VKSDVYRRTVTLGEARGVVSVRPAPGESALVAHIELDAPDNLVEVVERLRRIFDLGADPAVIAEHLGADRRLTPALHALPGVRIPGAWDPFEVAVRAILGQQVTVAGATTLAGRLAHTWGEPVKELGASPEDGRDALHRFFPRAEVLAQADLARIGLTRARARAIQGLASAVAEGRIALDGASDLEDTVASLCALPGIGPWTAHYIALRAFQDPDAFPDSDLGLRKALAGDGPPLSSAELSSIAEAWRPWRGYAAVLLWSSGKAPRMSSGAPE
jgi:AraC family transcriptional regulator of adaptative response / DNA-3-methyladenine glycosylase II